MRELGIINDGSVLIVNGRIHELGSTRRVEALAAARHAQEINAAGRVVAPGFVDCHTHLISGPVRPLESSGQDASPDVYWRALEQTSWRTLQAQTMRALEHCIRYGTTTVEAKSGFGLSSAAELKVLRTHAALNARTGMLASTFMASRWLPTIPTDDYLDWLCAEMLPVVSKRGLAQFADIACERDLYSVSEARRFLSVAKQLGLTPKIHAGMKSSIGAVAEAVRLNAASVDHLIHVSDEDVRSLASGPTIATLLPGPVFFTGSGRYAPARRLIDEGAAVAIATNYNAHTSPSQNMQMMIALGCRKMGMTVAEAVSAATINAAHAVRRSRSIGSIKHGKIADVIILGIPDYRELPYHFGTNMVDITIKNGRIVHERSEVRWPGLSMRGTPERDASLSGLRCFS